VKSKKPKYCLKFIPRKEDTKIIITGRNHEEQKSLRALKKMFVRSIGNGGVQSEGHNNFKVAKKKMRVTDKGGQTLRGGAKSIKV